MFKLNCGIDLVEIARIEKSLKRAGFLEKMFNEKEIAMFAARGNKPAIIAGNFAVKEAFLKSLSKGIGSFNLRDIYALRGDGGEPILFVEGKALEHVKEQGLAFSVSISHTKTLATAIVIAYKKNAV